MLRTRSRHSIALFAGTGPSSGVMTSEQIRWISNHMDIWSLNQFFLHKDLIPDFYMLEMRTLKEVRSRASNAPYWEMNFDEQKRKRYAKTVFLARSDHYKLVAKVLRNGSTCPAALLAYGWKRTWECRKKVTTAPFDPLAVTDWCATSLSRVFDMMARLQYSHVALIGVDLQGPYHFYTPGVNPAYGDIQHPAFEKEVIAFNTKLYGKKTHATAGRGIVDFIRVFSAVHQIPVITLVPGGVLAQGGLPALSPGAAFAGDGGDMTAIKPLNVTDSSIQKLMQGPAPKKPQTN
mmetsp:Transcript_58276/g.131995  ORF Transcript_58276/g.131995 Transcript_58276/m.131995 type:complete len:291 (-) Transcript_58276:91-963(-)